MTDRVIDIADGSVFLRVDLDRLAIERPNQPTVFVPLNEVAAVVVSSYSVSLTQQVLARLAANGGIFVAVDERFAPAGMFLPLDTHSTQAARFRKQADATRPVRKRIWQGLVRAKIRAQWKLLAALDKDSSDGETLVEQVRSGDPDNVEAMAAARYWKRLFGPEFRRDRAGADQNRLLNYGYTVLRSATARAICGAGLHPGLGVHHHNQYSAFCLADDLMEPYRPIVDCAVHAIVRRAGDAHEITKQLRAEIIGALLDRFEVRGERRTLFDLLARSATGLAKSLTGESSELDLWVP
jgi:CRISPR-associated protein Cas1